MNLYLILALVIGWGASVGGAFFYGQGVGSDSEIAGQAKIKQAILDTREKAAQGTAEILAAMKPINTTIVQKVRHEVQTNTVYATCRVPADGVQLANKALTGRQGEPLNGVVLPGAGAAK